MDLLNLCRTFVRVVEVGSYSRAARALGLSLAAVSRQIAALESELGALLLARTTRTLRLTDEGRRFHEHARHLLAEAELARGSVRRDRAIAGTVVMSASVTLGVLRIIPGLPALKAAHPALRLRLRLEDRAAELVSEGVDLAVRAGMSLPDSPNLLAVQLATFSRQLVASPAYLRRHGTPRSVETLAAHPVVVGIDSADLWRFQLDDQPRQVSVTPVLQVGTLLGIHAAVVAGLGLAILPDFVVADDLAAGQLRVVLPQARPAPVMAHALYRTEQRGVPRLEALVQHLRATLPLARRRREAPRAR
jgi:DNA-binding transcriptional LysR family regulator